MKSWVPILVLLVGAGCGAPRGNGRWDLTIGGEAKLVSPGGSDIVLKTLAAPPRAKAGRSVRASPTTQVETTIVPVGTRVDVLAIDGDDARIRIKDGQHVGLATWVECAQLEPVAR